MIACCGLNCSTCEGYLATQADDDAMRKSVAEKWSKLYDIELKSEDINCDGCIVEGRKFFYSDKMCRVRLCCKEKGLGTCAACEQYQCDILKEFLANVPAAEASLEKLRKHMDTMS